MHRTLICTLLLAGGIAIAQDPSKAKDRSTAQTAGETNRMENMANDKAFVMNAAIGGMAEVEMGKLAAQKATDERVKQFGQKMVDDHGKANEDLKNVASAQKIDIPVSLDSKHQATIDRLSKLSGSAFDRAYVREMVTDHNQDVKEFQKESQNGQDSAVRAFASKTLPTLQEHQRMILDISKNSTKSTSADRSRQ
jgi:putative membrane protein